MSTMTVGEWAEARAGTPKRAPRSTAVRLFLTCWLVFVLHFASNTVREIYLALAIGDHLSFRVDDYANMHPDLFEKKGYGWHIGANPGASMIGAIPYALARPAIDRIVERVNRSRRLSGQMEPPAYNSPWPMAREFYREAWKRGYDVKFGLGALVMQAFAMAPISALGVVAMFFLLRRLFESDRAALWLSFLYAFGTPVFFRTGYLNHNLMLGHFAFLGFLAMWNPAESRWGSTRLRFFLGGLAGGAALLLDYSGMVMLLGLFAYGLRKQWKAAPWYVLGTLGPVFLLWFYQYMSFGNFFLPGQNWMPPVEWIGRGYQGFGPPQWELLGALAFDYRYGLFTTCPLFLLALAAPFLKVKHRVLPRFEMWFILALFAAFWLFCGGINYTRLQFNTGIRYLAPVFPFLFVPAATVLMALPRVSGYLIGVLSIAQAWCLAMYRDVERGLGVLDPVAHALFGGFMLPILGVLARMGAQYGDYFEHGVSPLPLFLLAAALIYALWSPRFRKA
jgi:hypothetical protein